MTAPAPSKSGRSWTTRDLLDWIEGHLSQRGVDEPLLVARWLVASAVGTDPIHLYTDLERPASESERLTLRELVTRAGNHEPVQYLIGQAGFLGRIFEVRPGVLIPRTATETLVQHVLTWHRGLDPDARPDPLRVVDVGTGSGCIAVTIALQQPSAEVVAIDCEPAALELTRTNAESHGVADRVSVVQGDLCGPLVESVDVLVSNPPYIDDARWSKLATNVRAWEPEKALRGGPDGLDVVRRLLSQAPDYVRSEGLLVVETDDHHARAACALAAGSGDWRDARVLKDEFGDDRFVTALRV